MISNDYTLDKRELVYKDEWINYPYVKKLIENLQLTLFRPRTKRPKSILLIGETNSGKTAILNRFAELNPAYIHEKRIFTVRPYVYVEAPTSPNVGKFFDDILKAVNYPIRSSYTTARKENTIYDVLSKLETRVIAIDEVQHLFGAPLKQREFLNTLKQMTNKLGVSILAAGNRGSFNVINSDPQMANRFNPYIIPKWEYGDDYRRFLLTLETRMPFDSPSGLPAPEPARKILELSEGYTGEIVEIVQLLADYALLNGKKAMNPKDLSKISYVPPSLKRKAAYVKVE